MKSRTNSRPHQSRSNDHQPRSTDGAREHYRREKARRATAPGPEDELIAAAKREYLALLEAEAAKGKGGRPKKKPAAPKHEIEPDEDLPDDESEESEDEAESEEADEE
ncbi:MAG TPA: hypothetical protein VHB25_17920 [Gemmatimonadaceae bacterium]|nr:hypothetical protein [Gemmatimonadaceae bacterium]